MLAGMMRKLHVFTANWRLAVVACAQLDQDFNNMLDQRSSLLLLSDMVQATFLVVSWLVRVDKMLLALHLPHNKIHKANNRDLRIKCHNRVLLHHHPKHLPSRVEATLGRHQMDTLEILLLNQLRPQGLESVLVVGQVAQQLPN